MIKSEAKTIKAQLLLDVKNIGITDSKLILKVAKLLAEKLKSATSDSVYQYVINQLNIDLANVLSELDTINYRFFYKDKLGELQSKVVSLNKDNNELAIAKFEKENPDITWRSFVKS